MRRLLNVALSTALVSSALVWAPFPAQASDPVSGPTGVDYRYVYIDTPGLHGRALGVSDGRTVVGYYLMNAVIEQPFVFDEIHGSSTLPLDAGMRHGGATAISRNGTTIGGWEETTTGDCWAVRWVKDSAGSWTVQQLVHHDANDVNVVGCADDPVAVGDDGSVAISTSESASAQDPEGLLWTTGGVTTLAGQPRGMGSSGEVVGFLADPRIGSRPWREVGGTFMPPTGAITTEADGIARDGSMIVTSDVGNFERHPDGTYLGLQNLPTTDVTQASRVRAISDHNEIVGDSDVAALVGGVLPHAVRWDDDGSVIDLNDVVAHDQGETLVTATAVNKDGDIVGGAMSDRTGGLEAPMLLVAMPPIIFIPGVAGSHLVGADGNEQWINCLGFHDDLGLPPDGSTSIYADDVLRFDKCGPGDALRSNDTDAYGPFINAIEAQGPLVEYNEAKTPSRWTTAGCDVSQRVNHPNLFLFPYDWRQSNSVSALELADFMGCVRKFYTGPVLVVAHSMGGLVARRYILDHSGDSHHVRDLLTIGTPWLGAPKLIRAEETGDFIPHLMTNSTVKKVVPTMPGPGQLLPSAAYYNLAPAPFVEAGWDINNDQNEFEPYTHAQVDALLDSQYANHSAITANADAFHAYSTPEGSQDDWTNDKTDVNYIVMYGVHKATDTPGPVTAGLNVSCTTVLGIVNCSLVQGFKIKLVDGDGTVPLESSTRQGNGLDLNNHDHETLIPVYGSTYGDDTTEHTGLTRNSLVQQTVLKTDGRVGSGAQSALKVRTAALSATPAASTSDQQTPPQWDVDISGLVGSTTVTAPDGTDDAVVGGTFRPALSGVSHLSEGDSAELDVIPDSSGTYAVTFTAGTTPIQIDVRRGAQGAPIQRRMWTDLAVPAGHKATLTLADSEPSLEFDSDGDGTVDTGAAASFSPDGYYLQDVTPPSVQISAIVLNGTREYVLRGTDDDTGVADVMWSADGHQFQKYDGPIALAAGAPLTAFADDYAGNRSGAQTFDLGSVATTPFTTATTVPDLPPGGVSKTPVTVYLHARPSDGTTISNITYLDNTGTHVVPGDSATIEVTTGAYLIYYATDSSGVRESPQYMPVSVDTTPPTVSISSPAPDAVVNGLHAISGKSNDQYGALPASTSFAVSRNSDGAYWDGSSWQPGERWLATKPGTDWWTGTWDSAAPLPSGNDLTAGAYTIHARAFDGAGNVGTVANEVTVTTAAIITKLDPPGTFAGHPTYAFGVNDSGQVTGMTNDGTVSNPPVRWDADGTPHLLDGGYYHFNWLTGLSINNAGQVAGRLPNQAGMWQPDGTEVPLNGDIAQAINNNGVVAGAAYTQWVIWTNGVQKALPNPTGFSSMIDAPGGTNVRKIGGINDSGTVVATRWTTEPAYPGQPVAAMAVANNGIYAASYLFPPSDPTSHPARSGALGVNTQGDIVGWGGVDRAPSSAGYTAFPPFLRKADGTVQWFDLAAEHETCGIATSINDNDLIVGYGSPSCGAPYFELNDHDASRRAWVIEDGVVKDLTSMLPADSGWVLNEAWDISNTGEIAGTGTYNGKPSAFVLSLGAAEAVDHAPVATDLNLSTDAGTPLAVALHASDADNDPLTWSVGQPSHGSLSPVNGNSLTYTPESGFNGVDTFTVQVSDGTYLSNTATVTVAVGTPPPPSFPPTASVLAPNEAAEGTAFVVDGSDSAAVAAAGALSYSWDLNDDGVFGDATTPTATVSVPDDGDRVVRLRVSGLTGSSETSRTISIVNVSPVVRKFAGGSVGSGGQYTAAGDFTDPGADTWTATVDYGDGTRAQALSLSDKTFELHHAYSAPGSYWVSVQVCDDDGGCGTRSARVDVVGGGTVTATGTAVSATEGVSFSGAVASFTYTDASATAGQFGASIDWGDGSASTAGVISRNADGSFRVAGIHTYADEGSFPVSVDISAASGTGTSATSTAAVADAPLRAMGIATPASPNPVAGLTLATFTDANPAGSASDFTASIDWGDGTTTQGVVTQLASGSFAVSGDHTYETLGPRTVGVAITDVGGSTAQAQSQLIVYGVAQNGSFLIGNGAAALGNPAQFWGAGWWKANSLSGGSAPADFVGFAPGVPPAACGGSWTSSPGVSSGPPTTVPEYLAVVVTDRVSRAGSALSGEVSHVVVVKTDSGYQPDAGHRGTGTVVATIC